VEIDDFVFFVSSMFLFISLVDDNDMNSTHAQDITALDPTTALSFGSIAQ
jgi:hypothetical protein